MTLTHAKKQQIIQDLGIRSPVHRWQQHRDGSVTVYTRAGSQKWKPKPRRRSKPKAEKSGDKEA